jgi:hypothetical protein
MDTMVDYGYDHTDEQLIWNLPHVNFYDNGLSFSSPPVRSVREDLSLVPSRKYFLYIQMFIVGGVLVASKVDPML